MDLYTAKRNQMQMVKDRGYDVSAEEEAYSHPDGTPLGPEEFYDLLSSQVSGDPRTLLTERYRHFTDSSKEDPATGETVQVPRYLEVYYAPATSGKQRLGVNSINSFVAEAESPSGLEGLYDISFVLVVSSAPSPEAHKQIDNIANLYRVQVFDISEFLYNPTLHVLGAKHEVLSPKEALSFLQEAKARLGRLPILLDSDPIAKYWGWVPGDIVRIRRPSLFTDSLLSEQLFYRAVGKRRVRKTS